MVIVTVERNAYGIHFLHKSKDEAIHLLRNTDLTEKSGTLKNIKLHYHI